MLFSSKAVASASKVAARGFHASAKAEARKFFVGGKYIFSFYLHRMFELPPKITLSRGTRSRQWWIFACWKTIFSRVLTFWLNYILGNWKCNGSVSQTKELISMLNQQNLTQNTEVVVCPSQVHLQSVKDGLRTDVAVGAQDCWVQGNGAFTGETSADMLTDMGVQWAIIGHSERRGKGESDAEVAAKAKYALDKGLSVMACCGEPLEAREAGTTNDFVFPQIKAYADAFTKEDWKRVVIAYEPIWAIGTGLTATPEQAQDTHAAIRQYLGEIAGADVAAETRILYGGSASGATAPGLSEKEDIDGMFILFSEYICIYYLDMYLDFFLRCFTSLVTFNFRIFGWRSFPQARIRWHYQLPDYWQVRQAY